MALARAFVTTLLYTCPCHLASGLQAYEHAAALSESIDDSVALLQTTITRPTSQLQQQEASVLRHTVPHSAETGVAVVALLLAVVLFICFQCMGLGPWLYSCCFEARKTGSAQARVEGPRRLTMQLSALVWKNVIVNTRSQLPLCLQCCNACCLQMCCPIWNIFALSALPLLLMHAMGADHDLQVDFPMEFGRDYKDPTLQPQRSLPDHLFSEPSLQSTDNLRALWYPLGGLPQGACFCRTLGIVGPKAADFQAFADESYSAWRNQRERIMAGQPGTAALARAACPAQTSATLFRVFDRSEDVDQLLERVDYATVPPERSLEAPDRLCGVVVFENDPLTSSVPKFVVRANVTGRDPTGGVARKELQQQTEGIDWGPFNWYLRSGFLSMQDLVQRYLSERRAGNLSLPEPRFVPLPSPPRHSNTVKNRLAVMIADQGTGTNTLVVTLMLVVYQMIRERNKKQKEFMRLMGLYDSSLVLSWLSLFALMNFICMLACSVMVYGYLAERSDFLVVFLIFFLVSLATISMGMAISSLFASERLGTVFAFAFSTLIGLISTTSNHGDLAWSEHPSDSIPSMPYLLCLFPNMAYVLCFRTFFAFDHSSRGCTMWELSRDRDGFSIGGGLGMLLFDIFFWALLHMYLEEVIPHEVGSSRPWYFPVTPSFWNELLARGTSKPEELQWDEAHAAQDPTLFESEETAQLQQLRQGNSVLMVHGLRKRFTKPDGSCIDAVNGLTLTMYPGECFCLLGHNGAGKTTAMGVITGMLSPTAGSIQVKGLRMPEEKVKVRSDMGFCMQQNILWEELTVREHMSLFGALRGFTPSATNASADTALARVELLHKQDARADALSGGMKRKLNVASALLGSAGVVLLDEPTAGMDPHTRRRLWGTLKQERKQCIMCLTTHYMDEADELGDRVCIMVRGRAACNGTNSFLKQRLGCGYVLSFVKKSEETPNQPIHAVVASHCGPDVGEVSSAGRELRLRVPFTVASAFPAMMRDMDARLESLGLESYGVGVSDLEDVFLHVAAGEQPPEAAQESAQGAAQREAAGTSAKASYRQEPSLLVQLAGLFMRRAHYGRRDSRTFCFQLLAPSILMVAFLGHLKLVTHKVGAFDRVEMDASGGPSLVTVGVSGSASPIALAWQAGQIPGVGEVRLNYTPPSEQAMAFLPPGSRQRDVEEFLFSNQAHANAFGSGTRGLFTTTASKLPQLGAVLYSNDTATLFPNTRATWGAPALLNLHFTAAMRAATTPSAPDHVEMASEPLPATRLEQSFANGLIDFSMALTVMSALAFVPAGIAAYVTLEREVGIKQQLMVSGASRLAYWLSNLIFDSVFGLFTLLATLVILAVFESDAWCSEPNIQATITLLALYIPAVCAFAYFWSQLYESSGSALVGVLVAGLLVGTVGLEMAQVLMMLQKTRRTGRILLWLVRAAVPSVCVGDGLMRLAVNKDVSRALNLSPFSGELFGTHCSLDTLGCPANAGDDIAMLVISTVLYTVAFAVYEVTSEAPSITGASSYIIPWELRRKEDENVLAEKKRVSALDPATQVLTVDTVSKVYETSKGPVHAVRGVSFAVDAGSIFGLLGTNGAGKTSTFKMICGQLVPTSGRIFVGGRSTDRELQEVRKHIGYCPQFDALLDLMTVQEHLNLFAAVKGLQGEEANAECTEKMETLGLTEYKDCRAGQLSGGNKRKLSTAMALIREPEVIFLDEPSAGMDPVARRRMWEVIQAAAASRRSSAVVLTTHSMEEADALCTRIGIQCSGQLRCLGSPQQLKAQYGTGLELNLRLEPPTCEESLALCTDWGEEPSNSCGLSKAQQLVASYFSGPSRIAPAKKWNTETTLSLALAEWCLQEERAAAVDAFLEEICRDGKEVTCVEAAGASRRYKLSGNSPGGGPMPYSELFAALQGHQQELHLADFQLSQGTLESTFNRLAAEDLALAEAQDGEES